MKHRSLTGGDANLTPQQRYHSNDRFRTVRTNGGEEWLEYVCRADDLLVHTSGEMTNPLPWEQRMMDETSAVVVGANLPRSMALVELPEGASAEDEELLTELRA